MIFVLPDPVYGQRYVVAVNEGDAKILAKLKSEGVEVTDEIEQKLQMRGYGRSLYDPTSHVHVLRLRRLDHRQPNDAGVLAHEALHLAVALFSQIHQPIGVDNDEPMAYYVQFLVRETLRGALRR